MPTDSASSASSVIDFTKFEEDRGLGQGEWEGTPTLVRFIAVYNGECLDHQMRLRSATSQGDGLIEREGNGAIVINSGRSGSASSIRFASACGRGRDTRYGKREGGLAGIALIRKCAEIWRDLGRKRVRLCK